MKIPLQNAKALESSWQHYKQVRLMLEMGVVTNCAPTLAGMKSANLFSYRYASKTEVERELNDINRKLNPRGVYVEALLWRQETVLVYAYRKIFLEADLQQDGVRQLLSRYGYHDYEVGSCLIRLKERLAKSECFPHEIGIFLGYPLEDVIGFIDHKGKDCKLCGMWKVYGNVNETGKLFQKLKKCSDIYTRVFQEGRSITQMTVCI